MIWASYPSIPQSDSRSSENCPLVRAVSGSTNALLPQQALDGGPYIEYLEHYRPETDLPHAWIIARTAKIWGPDTRA